MLDSELILKGEILSWSLVGVKGLKDQARGKKISNWACKFYINYFFFRNCCLEYRINGSDKVTNGLSISIWLFAKTCTTLHQSQNKVLHTELVLQPVVAECSEFCCTGQFSFVPMGCSRNKKKKLSSIIMKDDDDWKL